MRPHAHVPALQLPLVPSPIAALCSSLLPSLVIQTPPAISTFSRFSKRVSRLGHFYHRLPLHSGPYTGSDKSPRAWCAAEAEILSTISMLSHNIRVSVTHERTQCEGCRGSSPTEAGLGSRGSPVPTLPPVCPRPHHVAMWDKGREGEGGIPWEQNRLMNGSLIP